MAVFDALIHDAAIQFGLGDKAAPLVSEAAALVAGQPGGLKTFLDRFQTAGLGTLAASWLGKPDAAPIPTADFERAISAPALDAIAHRLDIALPASNAALAWVIPKLVGLLTPGRVVPAALPTEIASLIPSATSVVAPPATQAGNLPWRVFGAALGVAIVAGLIWLFGQPPAGGPAVPTPAPPTATAPAAPASPAASTMQLPAPAKVGEPPAAAPPAKTAEAAPTAAPATPSLPATLALTDVDGAVQVSGAVHDDETRGSILDALKGAFGVDKVQGDVTVDPNRAAAPWLDKFGAALGGLKVPSLSAAFEGGAVKLHGALPEADLGKIADALKAALGTGTTVEAIVDAAPATATPAPAPAGPTAPAQLTVEDVNGAAKISGVVRDDETRASILDALKGAFGPDKVQGDVAVDPNRAAAPWLDRLGAALGGLKVPGLTAAFEGAEVKLHGALPEADLGKVADALKNALGAGTSVETSANAAPAATTPSPAAVAPPAPAQLTVEDVNGAANISGVVRDDETRASILDALKGAFGADKVQGDVAVDPNRAVAPWIDKLGAALGDLKVPGLKAAFDGARVDLGGAVNDAELNRIADSLTNAMGGDIAIKTPSGVSEETAHKANDQALQALNGLQPGFSGADLVADLNLTIINFATGSAEVPGSMRDLLAAAAPKLKQLPAGSIVEIAGYTDNTGDPALNVALSQSRADSVRSLLVANGAPAEMLAAKGYGSADPVASNDTAEGRSRNRRIEYHLKTP